MNGRTDRNTNIQTEVDPQTNRHISRDMIRQTGNINKDRHAVRGTLRETRRTDASFQQTNRQTNKPETEDPSATATREVLLLQDVI